MPTLAKNFSRSNGGDGFRNSIGGICSLFMIRPKAGSRLEADWRPAEARSLPDWYNHVSGEDKARITEVVKRAADSAVFGFFAILDGVRVVESTKERGRFELYYVTDGKSVLLNEFGSELLHDLYNRTKD